MLCFHKKPERLRSSYVHIDEDDDDEDDDDDWAFACVSRIKSTAHTRLAEYLSPCDELIQNLYGDTRKLSLVLSSLLTECTRIMIVRACTENWNKCVDDYSAVYTIVIFIYTHYKCIQFENA